MRFFGGMTRQRPTINGFTLLELIISLACLFLAINLSVALLFRSLVLLSRTLDQGKALVLLENFLEDFYMTPYSLIEGNRQIHLSEEVVLAMEVLSAYPQSLDEAAEDTGVKKVLHRLIVKDKEVMTFFTIKVR